MRTPLVLFTFFISLYTLPFCQCGDEDKLKKQDDESRIKKTLSIISDDVFEDALTDQPQTEASSIQGDAMEHQDAPSDQSEDDEQEGAASRPVSSTLPPSICHGRSRSNSIEPLILDISHPLSNTCKSIDVDINGIPAEVFIPAPGVAVTRVVDGNNKITNIDEKSAKFLACVTFLSSNEPSIMAVITRTAEGLHQKYYKNVKTSGCLHLRRTGWKESKKNYGKKIDTFRIRSDTSTKVPLDISDTFDNTNYRMITHENNTITTRYYATKPGYIMERIYDQGVEVSHFVEDAICFLCEIHNKDDYSLMRLHIRKDHIFYFCYEKKEGSRWAGIVNKDFDEALGRMYEEFRFSE